jgi:hypothetical protein
MLELHNRYGDIVRIAPSELAFSHPDAWKDIMGHKKGEPEMEKLDGSTSHLKTSHFISSMKQESNMVSCGGKWPMGFRRRR